jgi:hypothetical protein
VITTSLRLLEEQIVACRKVVNGAGTGTRLVVHRNRFSREARDDLICRLDSLLAMITRMSEQIGVDPAVVSVPSLLSAILSSAWETLEELRPNRLKGYGAVDPTADRELTAFVEATTEEIRQILDTAHRYRRPQAPDGRGAVQ